MFINPAVRLSEEGIPHQDQLLFCSAFSVGLQRPRNAGNKKYDGSFLYEVSVQSHICTAFVADALMSFHTNISLRAWLCSSAGSVGCRILGLGLTSAHI